MSRSSPLTPLNPSSKLRRNKLGREPRVVNCRDSGLLHGLMSSGLVCPAERLGRMSLRVGRYSPRVRRRCGASGSALRGQRQGGPPRTDTPPVTQRASVLTPRIATQTLPTLTRPTGGFIEALAILEGSITSTATTANGPYLKRYRPIEVCTVLWRQSGSALRIAASINSDTVSPC